MTSGEGDDHGTVTVDVVARSDAHRDRGAGREARVGLRDHIVLSAHGVEKAALQRYGDDQVALLRRMLFEIIGDSNDPGSCL